MDQAQLEFIEKYQILYQENPQSKVFAPLSEAYRKAGMIDAALDVCLQGVKLHPNFAGGHVALARVYIEKKEIDKAVFQLEKAIENSPENILAQSLLADCYLQLREPKKALQAYKMLLFLSPENEKAIKAVKKLEAMTADEFSEEDFQMKPVDKMVLQWEFIDAKSNEAASAKINENAPVNDRILDRFISLVDAHITRNNFDQAEATLNEAEQVLGPLPDIVKRRKMLRHQLGDDSRPQSGNQKPMSREEARNDEKVQFLEELLEKIEARKHRNLTP